LYQGTSSDVPIVSCQDAGFSRWRSTPAAA